MKVPLLISTVALISASPMVFTETSQTKVSTMNVATLTSNSTKMTCCQNLCYDNCTTNRGN